MGKHAKLKEKQKWSEERIHLENARKLRGIYFIDPEDMEFKETIKNARKKLETSVPPAMPCKIVKSCGSGASNKIQTKLECILEANDVSTQHTTSPSPPHLSLHICLQPAVMCAPVTDHDLDCCLGLKTDFENKSSDPLTVVRQVSFIQ